MQQAHGLEEIKLVRMLEEPFVKRNLWFFHSTLFSPTRAGQRKIPLRCFERAVSRL
jgi:hypothetical protein